jgi:hypothetical protein
LGSAPRTRRPCRRRPRSSCCPETPAEAKNRATHNNAIRIMYVCIPPFKMVEYVLVCVCGWEKCRLCTNFLRSAILDVTDCSSNLTEESKWRCWDVASDILTAFKD